MKSLKKVYGSGIKLWKKVMKITKYSNKFTSNLFVDMI